MLLKDDVHSKVACTCRGLSVRSEVHYGSIDSNMHTAALCGEEIGLTMSIIVQYQVRGVEDSLDASSVLERYWLNSLQPL